jgi:hypothetical protein
MAFFFNGATHIINRADAVVQTFPLTIHGRIRLTAVADGLVHCILGLWEAGSDNGFRLQVELNGGTMKARCGSKAGGAASNANSTTSITDTNWHSVVGEISAANARQVWLDNGGNGTNATSLTPGTLTKTSIGAHDNGGTLSGNVAHELADVAVWSGTLTAEERAALAAGVSPALIRPDILEIYVPLIRELNDQRGGTFSLTGATVADHPRVYMPSRAQQLVKTAAASAGVLSGGAIGGIAASATLSGAAAVVSTATIGIAGASSLGGALPITGVAAIGIASPGTLTVVLALTGAGVIGAAARATLAGTAGLVSVSPLGVAPASTLLGAGALISAGAASVVSASALTAFNPGAVSGRAVIGFVISGILTSPTSASIWTEITPGTGSWNAQAGATGIWTPIPPASGTWT